MAYIAGVLVWVLVSFLKLLSTLTPPLSPPPPFIPPLCQKRNDLAEVWKDSRELEVN